ncbi:hypothetical protein [Teredinibacter turnerae]|uniref:hypothetical protein n=1 Tax=Teredinibacter turnerae TaxID=2426 RepID=UPI0003604EE2|nr:hypothetical protein [Teredinibacter turnerae]
MIAGDRFYFRLIVIISVWLLPTVGSADEWDGVQREKIARFEVAGGENFGFRVFLSGITDMCSSSGGVNWAYLNASDSNYDVFVAVLLASCAMDSAVTLYTKRDSSGFCHIGYLGG